MMTDISQMQHMTGAFGSNGGAAPSSQTQTIRAIQQSRSEESCFATDRRYDCAEICDWRRDCRKLVAAWLR